MTSSLFGSAVVACVLSASVALPSAEAALIEVDSGYGAGSGTHDTATGLEWLDWTVTTNISYNNMIPQLETGGDYEGWRYATQAEVETLFFTSHGIVVSPTATRIAQILALQDLLGVTSEFGTLGDPEAYAFRASHGIYDIPFSLGRQMAGLQLSSIFPLGDFQAVFADALSGSIGNSFGDAGTGHILVRTVPEPSSLVLLGLGGLALLRRARTSLRG